MQTLILFGYSGFDENHRASLSSLVGNSPDCGIVLMEDAVIGTIPTMNGASIYRDLETGGKKVYCLKEDCQARGLDPTAISPGIELITYATLIDLIETTARVVSWL